jgi:type II secretory pathway pseudopilin PulG
MKSLVNAVDKKGQLGLTLIEMIIVVGIIMSLLGIAFLNISNIRVVSSGGSATTVLISDLKNQQIKAMTGDTEGRGVADNYGIKILPDKYVLFHGLTYIPSETSNFTVPIDDGQTLSTTFQNDVLIFSSNSGEMINFVEGQDTVNITTDAGETKAIRFNKYGTVTQIN